MELCLGTVQFGTNYGINQAKVSFQDAEDILVDAVAHGIHKIDTASAYGNAEQVIGNIMSDRELLFDINSKLYSKSLDRGCVVRSILKSLENLKIDQLHGYLLHRAEYLKNRVIMDELLECKCKGLVRQIGVSTYTPEEAMDAIRNEAVDCIEVPYNILDLRLDEFSFFEKAHKQGKKVYLRSIFLQGILLMEEDQLTNYLRTNAWKWIDVVHRAADSLSITVLQLILDFMKTCSADYLVFGVENAQQYYEIVAAFEKADTGRLDFGAFRQQFADIPENVLNPSKWSS